MSYKEEDERRSGKGLPMLGRTNWPQFRDAFMDYALSQGRGGMILIRGVDDGIDGDARKPEFNMVRLVPDVDNPGSMVEGIERKYPNSAVGVSLFQKDETKYEEIMNSKLKLISKLLMHMEDDVRAKVETLQGFKAARNSADILTVWRITEQVVQGTGVISIFSLSTKLHRLKQGDQSDWARYSKEWLTTVTDLQRAGTAEEVLKAMLTTHLVFSVNQDQFRDKLVPIYGSTNWPDYDTILEQFNTFALNMERIGDLEGKANDGKMPAYAAMTKTTNNGNGCWNCGSGDQIRVNCPNPPATYTTL